MLEHADDEAAEDVDDGDDDAGDGVAADELAGTVHRTVEVGLVADALAAAAGLASLMMPAFRSASIAICLPGMASRVKRAATSEMRVGALGDHDELNDHEDEEDDDADDEALAGDEAAERLMTPPAASIAVRGLSIVR